MDRYKYFCFVFRIDSRGDYGKRVSDGNVGQFEGVSCLILGSLRSIASGSGGLGGKERLRDGILPPHS